MGPVGASSHCGSRARLRAQDVWGSLLGADPQVRPHWGAAAPVVRLGLPAESRTAGHGVSLQRAMGMGAGSCASVCLCLLVCLPVPVPVPVPMSVRVRVRVRARVHASACMCGCMRTRMCESARPLSN